ncbi:MAG: cytochrome c [Planctomycetota bacterium]
MSRTPLDHDYAPKGLMRSALQNPAFSFAIGALRRFRRPPFLLLGFAVAGIIASFIPITWSVYYRFAKSPDPRPHLFLDMDNQAKYKAQAPSPVFEDGRAMRLPVPGTVARGELIEDEKYALGYVMDGQGNVTWVEGMPDGLEVDEKFMKRGQELYNRFCWLCHGYDGYGNGPIHVRAVKGQNALWVTPSNLHDETRLGRADGHLYNTVNNGIRNMAGYGTLIRDPKDRWAVVAYVRALQLSQAVPAGEVDPSLVANAPVQPALTNGKPPVVEEPAEETDTEQAAAR